LDSSTIEFVGKPGKPTANVPPATAQFADKSRMRMNFRDRKDEGRGAFSLVEVMFAVGIVGVVFVSLYAAISQGFAVVQTARENLRATQIMQEQVEILRVLDWAQITTTPSPLNFTASFYPAGGANPGVTYSGTINITNTPATFTGSYLSDMRLAVVSLSWQGGKVTRQRELRTLLSHYGLHNYFLNP